jgi:hypothetical protein
MTPQPTLHARAPCDAASYANELATYLLGISKRTWSEWPICHGLSSLGQDGSIAEIMTVAAELTWILSTIPLERYNFCFP